MKNLVMRFVRDETGATAIEYGLIAAGISVAIIAVVQGLGSKLNTTFTSVQTALDRHAAASHRVSASLPATLRSTEPSEQRIEELGISCPRGSSW